MNQPAIYQPRALELAIQAAWTAADVYTVVENNDKPKFYACSMLPYPSGKLHMGHVRNYTINDVMARQLRMKGYNVLMPMGWDAFGMPAENAAMNHKVPPAQWTYDNIAYMKTQMQAMGLSIDWSREFATCDADYYKWNQWFFLKMLDKGVAYRKTQVVNWDPIDQTVLANEQVVDGRGWRSGALVEKREIPGYYLNITAYAEELLTDLEDLGWPSRVKLMQENWIGKSVGVRFAFTHEIKNAAGELIDDGKMYVFTTRADTIMGVTFCAVAAEHPLATLAAESNPELKAFIEKCKLGSVMEADMATMEKEGMNTGLQVTHPLTGELIDVWVGNYVLMTYGDGAVMGVPAHDFRDFAFAKKYNIKIKEVFISNELDKLITWLESEWLKPESTHTIFSRKLAYEKGILDTFDLEVNQINSGQNPYLAPTFIEVFRAEAWHAKEGKDGFCINSGKYDGLSHADAIQAVAADLAAKGLGELKTTYRLRDWGISRQRYWGTPIPLIHCAACGVVPVPEADLPVILPTDCIPDGSGNPLNKRDDFVNVPCPQCGAAAKRETDTMDTFIDSSWYYMRYTSPNANQMVDERNDYWMPMDQYIGGIEHAILHLLYARFWTKVMRDMGLVSFKEPFKNLLTQGMVLNDTYYQLKDNGQKNWINPADVTVEFDDKGRPVAAKLKSDGSAVAIGGVEKMAKSKNNGIDPQGLIEHYGADTARLFTMFASPPEQTLEWSESGVEGSHRFLKRVWGFCQAQKDAVAAQKEAELTPSTAAKDLRFTVHTLLKQINFDYERLQYNTVASGTMKLLNELEAACKTDVAALGKALPEAISVLLRVLYPIAPHITTHLWNELGYADSCGALLDAPWAEVDESALERSDVTYMVQVNGKLRDQLTAPKTADKDALQAMALQLEHVQKFVGEQAVKKFIVVPNKLINIVV
ncbi:MAG: leucine--tRNA ligase [Formosimonas sp.]